MECKSDFNTVFQHLIYDNERKSKIIKVTKVTTSKKESFNLIDIRIYYKFEDVCRPSSYYGVSMTPKEFKEIWPKMAVGELCTVIREDRNDRKTISFKPVGARTNRLSVQKLDEAEKYIYLSSSEIDKLRQIMDQVFTYI
jgi:hypothetical protein